MSKTIRREATEFIFHEPDPKDRFKSQHRLDEEYEEWLSKTIASLTPDEPEETECHEENPSESK